MRGLQWRLVLGDMTRLGYVQLNTRMTGVNDSTKPRKLPRQSLLRNVLIHRICGLVRGRCTHCSRDKERANPSRALYAPPAAN